MRLAYVVSRFPVASETFILRELNALDGRDGRTIELFVLFAPDRPFVHPDAERWVARAHRYGMREGLAGLAHWARRRPLVLARAVALVVRRWIRRPGLLARALATLPLAARHAQRMDELGVDHIHAHFATYPALTAWLAARLTGATYSITAHAHDIFVDQSALDALVRDARFVAVISEFNARFLAPYGAGTATPAPVVRCGVDPAAYAFRPRRPAAAGPVQALCVASLQEYKGHRVLLDALAAGGPEVGRIHVDLVGTGPLEDELRAQVERLGLGGRVRFLGARTEAEVTELLAAADLFVLPSIVARNGQMEGVPVALMEALAAGVPTVTTRLSGIPELVDDGVTGLLAEPGDAASLADALRRLLADPDAAAARAEAGRGLVEREFDVHRSARRLGELFAGVGSPASGG